MAQTPPNQIPDITETELWVMRTPSRRRSEYDDLTECSAVALLQAQTDYVAEETLAVILPGTESGQSGQSARSRS